MAIYEAKNYTYYLQNNETPKMFDPMLGGNVFVKLYNVSILSDRKGTELSESEIRFEIAFVVLEISCYKHTIFLPIFRYLGYNWPTRLNPIFSKPLSVM